MKCSPSSDLQKGFKHFSLTMKQLHAENELSSEVLALLADFGNSNFDPETDNLIDDSWLDSFCEDRFGGEF
jgi:hypothetical protein